MAGLGGGKIQTIPPFITDSDQISDGVIIAAKIDVADLSAISANLGTITAGTITGTIIESALPGSAQIVINGMANSFNVFDASANDILNILGTPGSGSGSAVLNIQPAITFIQAISITMPASSQSYGIQIVSPSTGSAIGISISGSGPAIGIVADTSDITSAMVIVGDGGSRRNLMQLNSAYNGNFSNIMLDLQKYAGSGVMLNMNNEGLASCIEIAITNQNNNLQAILISASHGGEVLEIDQTNASNANNVVAITTANATIAPLFATGATVAGHFQRCIAGQGGVTIWMSDGTNPSGTLSANRGDLCLNGPSGVAYYCGGTTTWTAV